MRRKNRFKGFLIRRGLRVRNGAESIAEILQTWLSELGVRTLFIERCSPWEDGYTESFNGKSRLQAAGIKIDPHDWLKACLKN